MSLFAYGAMVPPTVEAAEVLSKEGIHAEVIDPRTLVPLDETAIIASVEKTGGGPCRARGGPLLRLRRRGRGDPRREGVLLAEGPHRTGHRVRHPVPVRLENLYLPNAERIAHAARTAVRAS